MTALVLLFAVVIGSVLQASVPAPAWLGHAQIPVMMGLVIYYAMVADRGTMIMAAILAGLVDDTLGLMPLGYSSFCYCVAGLICQGFRDVVIARQWTTHVFLGALSNAGVTIATFLLLVKDDLVQMGWLQITFKLLGSIVVGAVAVPIIFQVMTWLDHTVGNVELGEA